MLQEALVRGAVKFEYDAILGSDVAVAILDHSGSEIVDLRQEWLPQYIYGEAEYEKRVADLKIRRYYGRNSDDKAGILRYTKVSNHIYDLGDIPLPSDERQLSWLLSFYWGVDVPQDTVSGFQSVAIRGSEPSRNVLGQITGVIGRAKASGLRIDPLWVATLGSLGIDLT